MKRRNEENEIGIYQFTRSKKPCPDVQKSFVSGTDVRNYMLRDSLVDWLKLMHNKRSTNNPFVEFIMERGNDFEKDLVSYIHQNKVCITSVSNKITKETCAKTIRLMKEGIPVIHSAPFQSDKKHIKGVIDLLVRSDFLSYIVDENPLPQDIISKHAQSLSGQYHYVVVDIKFSTLPLRADGIHLLNSGNYPAYKAQLWIYTQGIGEIQGYTSRYAYILGRRWNYTSKGENFNSLNCLDKLGVIDYEGVDSDYPQRTQDAISWIRDLRKHGKNWVTNPPSRDELYPNMCVDSGEWNVEKKEIADALGDITQLWYCGIKHRQIALSKGIKSWKDKRCNSKTIGLNGVRAPVVDKIIEINKQSIDKVRPKKIKTNLHEWKKSCNEIFVDFETFCDVFATFENLPEQPKTDKIFMIGVYFQSSPSTWSYKNFVAKQATYEEEFRIMDEFVQFIRQQGNPKLWYWHADQTIWSRSENRQMDIAVGQKNEEKSDHIVDEWKLNDWHDLCQVFRDEPIVVKDCFRFGLKEIAGAMHKHGLIRAQITSKCHSGIDASVKAWQAYQRPNPETSSIIQDISKYNMFDVSVLQEILLYLRKNHMQ